MRNTIVQRTVCLCLLALTLFGVAAPPLRADDTPQSFWDPQGIEDFSLTERSGKTVTRKDLLGHRWLACFVFTACAGPCPRVTSQMKQLEVDLEGTDVRLVTFTVDPDRDTPSVLTDYANNFTADPERWLFLTGDKREIYHLIHNSFKMPVQETEGPDRQPGFEIIHSTNIMLVDAQGRVLEKFNATNEDDMARLRRVLRYPEWVASLPLVNASLNSLATLLLLAGFVLIKSGKVTAHKSAMLSAFAVSIAFLGCYLVYHYFAGSKTFEGSGVMRPVYFMILISHILLAAAVPFLAVMTIRRGFRGEWDRHKRLARITFPIWLYVSVTGVIIYGMLYHWPMG